MTTSEDENDKTFEPTPQKLLEARKKGEIARSNEVLTAAAYFGFFISLTGWGYYSVVGLGSAFSMIIDQADQLSNAPWVLEGNTLAAGFLLNVSIAALPMFAAPIVSVLAVLLATRGIIFAPTKIEPKIKKISIVQNAKNKFGRNGIFQFFVSFTKLLIYSFCLTTFLTIRLDDMISAIQTGPQYVILLMAEICLGFLLTIVIISSLIGGIDAIWQHFEHVRKNRMSRKEIMDEAKSSEGDPLIKQERRQRAQHAVSSSKVEDVADADVLIVNPTHYAVSLKWNRQKGSAPVCTAKGVDKIALKMREVAMSNSIPIHEDPPTARAIFAVTNLNEEISPEHYSAVAAAIRFAERMRAKSYRGYG